ncbi:hypothetical protein T492DRAFT_836842 [Pavlovales sp. CCMP2436]|nr:hypothetical protein T492DRAFT_836842 [Pavlovales sp. CCMP2436]
MASGCALAPSLPLPAPPPCALAPTLPPSLHFLNEPPPLFLPSEKEERVTAEHGTERVGGVHARIARSLKAKEGHRDEEGWGGGGGESIKKKRKKEGRLNG